MGMLSTYYKGKVRDWKFKVDDGGDRHCFYLDGYLIGQLFKSRRGWTSIPNEYIEMGGPVTGFRSRYDAAQFALQVVETVNKNQENE